MTQPPDPTAPTNAPEPLPGPVAGVPYPYPPPYASAQHPPAGLPPGPQPWMPPPAPKPGVIPLRPLGLGEILDGAISYIRANPKITLGMAAIVAAGSQLIQVAATALTMSGLTGLETPGTPSEAEVLLVMAGGAIALLLGVVVAFVAGTVLNGLLIAVLSRAVIGQRPSFGEVWTATRPRLLGLFGLTLLMGLAAFGVFLLAVVPSVVLAVAEGPVWLSVTMALLLLVGAFVAVVYLGVRWSMAAPAYVLENVSVTGALGRSSRLVRGTWWRIFGILLLAGIISLLLQSILSGPFTIASMVVGGTFTDPVSADPYALPALAISAIGTILAMTVAAPFSAGITGLLYIDQRMRREGLDMELAHTALMAQAEPRTSAPGVAQ
jgi:Membrane domain of glycerophosphoryl diester phosphodiesterase